MKYILASAWTILIMAIFVVIITVPPGTAMAKETTGIVISVTDKIEGLVWFIGLLVTCLGVMIGILIKVIWSAHETNKDSHKQIRNVITVLDVEVEAQGKSLAGLLGQHEVAFSLKGCAWEPVALKEAMATAITDSGVIKNALRDLLIELSGETPSPFSHQRRCDKPPYCGDHEMPAGVGGD